MLNDLSKAGLCNKTVLIRVDYNVPFENGQISDDTRIIQSLPTILYCLKQGAKVVLISHFGRPGGIDKMYSLAPIAEYLSKILPSNKIHFFEETIYEAKQFISSCVKVGEICLLENIRFYPEEESCNEEFSKLLASLGNIFINDAFSVSHRKHASTYGVSKFIDSYAGLALANEVLEIDHFINGAKSPKMCIIGGAKVSTKLPLIKNLVDKVDIIVCGGGIGISFAKVKYNSNIKSVGDSYFEEAKIVIDKAAQVGTKLLIPYDFCGLIDNEVSFFDIHSELPKDVSIYDIGPESAQKICNEIFRCKTVLWNGPVGKFEEKSFATGTQKIAKAVASATADGSIKSIIGGGDTVAAVNKFGYSENISYISTSGGAFLEYLEGRELPGIKAVSK